MMRKDENYFEMWLADRESIVNTMVRNMAADLECGYDYFGKSITGQREMIAAYKAETDAALDMFKGMEDRQVNRWCYYDLIKRGAMTA